jgi:hypothetical protein
MDEKDFLTKPWCLPNNQTIIHKKMVPAKVTMLCSNQQPYWYTFKKKLEISIKQFIHSLTIKKNLKVA